MKKLILGAMMGFGLLLGGCSEEAADKPTSKPVVEKEAEKPAEPVEKPADNSFKEDVMLEDMRNSYDGVATVTFEPDPGIYKVTPSPELAIEIGEMMDGTRSKDSWYGLVDGFEQLSERIKDDVGPGYGLALINPVNNDKTLLLLADGTVLYDIFKE